MTHKDYFKKYNVSIEQYGVMLVSLAFHGKNTPHGNKGFDIDDAKINNKYCRIEVKSKVSYSPTGRATVIHCNKNKFIKNGMNYLAVVLVHPDSYKVTEAWLITKGLAKNLLTKTKSQYIPVNKVREHKRKMDITNKLNKISLKPIDE